MKCTVLIIGAGPGGLRCAEHLSENGIDCVVLEKNRIPGQKICAGGITWNGLIERIPEKLIERSFSEQTITTPLQDIRISSRHPLVATVNRQKLGRFMTGCAQKNGARIITGARLVQIENDRVVYLKEEKTYHLSFDYLVGADGSRSLVRRFIGLGVNKAGIGINYTLPVSRPRMEWHFDPFKFGSGYSWIFPHADTTSVGVYYSGKKISTGKLNNRLHSWARSKGIDLSSISARTGKISYDYQGYRFGRFFLIGDAAGFASPLTGEGIYPAFISAEAVAGQIRGSHAASAALEKMVLKHRRHETMIKMAERNRMSAFVLSELSGLLLRFNLVSFNSFEMS
ncbi:MAG: monooxygenase [Proteobacteria bacterium]|nr:MAG: monooxygenase [Pseudomonadota bacterium]